MHIRHPRSFAAALGACLVLLGCGDDEDSNSSADAGVDTADTGGGDVTLIPCDGIATCSVEGSACGDDDTLIVCAPDEDGCLIEATTECASTEQFCDDTGAEAVCATPEACSDACDAEDTAECTSAPAGIGTCTMGADGCLFVVVEDCPTGESCIEGESGPECADTRDPCEGLARCDTEGLTCEDDTLVSCAANADGCLVRDETNCADTAEVCDESGDSPECAPVCEDASECSDAGFSCEGDVLSTCTLNGLGCLEYDAVDCTSLIDGATCDAESGLCETDGDPCEGLTLCDETTDIGCDGDVLAACVVDAFGCDVFSTVDCGAVEDGFCADDTCQITSACDAVPAEDVCVSLGASECVDGAPRSCGRNADGCLTWVTGEVCGDELVCFEGACVDVCDTRDTCDGDEVCDGSDLVSCELDGDGCLVEAGRETCAFGCNPEAVECASSRCEVAPCDPDSYIDVCLDGATLSACVREEAGDCFYAEVTDCAALGTDFVCLDDGFFTTCTEAPCGDGFSDGFIGEECDDGNTEPDDGCSDECVIEEGFQCEFTREGMSVCTEISCGNGVLQGDEECDDGDDDDDDGCSATCTIEDDYVCVGEPSFCIIPACGDDIVSPAEACDDGNAESGDGCSATCALELPTLPGDFVTIEGSIDAADALWDRPAECEAGSGEATHHYDAFRIVNPSDAPIEVRVDAFWGGDGYLHLFGAAFDPESAEEACLAFGDDHPVTSSVGSLIESFTAVPGVEYVLVASTSSAGAIIGAYTIDITARGCGDGAPGDEEACDDGNFVPSDGCTDCLVDEGYTCDDDGPSYCYTDGCGGGALEEGEACDDGNLENDDGCSDGCVIEDGYECTGEAPSVCFLVE